MFEHARLHAELWSFGCLTFAPESNSCLWSDVDVLELDPDPLRRALVDLVDPDPLRALVDLETDPLRALMDLDPDPLQALQVRGQKLSMAGHLIQAL